MAINLSRTTIRGTALVLATAAVAVGATQFMQAGSPAAAPGAAPAPQALALASAAEAAPTPAEAPVPVADPAPEAAAEAAPVENAQAVMAGATPAPAEAASGLHLASADAALPALPRPPADRAVPALRVPPAAPFARGAAETAPAAPVASAAATPPQCDTVLSADALPGGMVLLTLTSPCHPSARIEVSHEALRFSDSLTPEGDYQVLVPALSAEAQFDVALDGSRYAAEVAAPDRANYVQAALQWTGETGLQIHALEFGAGYDQSGHVWAGQPQDVIHAVRAAGGFLTELGDPHLPDARLAEVYSVPRAALDRNGTVRLSVEAAVSDATCGRDVTGEALQQQADGTMQPVPLALSMPDCGEGDGILVLKDLLRDLKVASN